MLDGDVRPRHVAAEDWNNWDTLVGLMRQLGVVPSLEQQQAQP